MYLVAIYICNSNITVNNIWYLLHNIVYLKPDCYAEMNAAVACFGGKVHDWLQLNCDCLLSTNLEGVLLTGHIQEGKSSS